MLPSVCLAFVTGNILSALIFRILPGTLAGGFQTQQPSRWRACWGGVSARSNCAEGLDWILRHADAARGRASRIDLCRIERRDRTVKAA